MVLFADCFWIQALSQFIFACVLFKIAWGCYDFIRIYCIGSNPDFSKYGKWSVITGATDGIGLAFAKKLAEFGQNIVVVSRNPEKVKSVAEEIRRKYEVETKEIVVDFSGDDIYDKIKCELERLDVGLLVNNVGMASQNFGRYLDSKPGEVEKIIKVNMQSAVKMTKIILPCMVKKTKGVILNISSGSGIAPTPMISLYSSTKRFVDCFSKCINVEYGSKGVTVQCIMPFFVTTKLSRMNKTNLLVVDPDYFVSAALKTVGKCRRSYGCVSHLLQGKLIEILPESLISWFLLKTFEKARAKNLKLHGNKMK